MKRSVSVVLPAVFICALRVNAALNYTIIDVPGATSTYATAINNAGDVAGYWDNGPTNSSSTISQGFLLRSGTSTPVPISVGGATSTRIWAISDSGILFGSYVDSNGGLRLFSYNNPSGSGLITPSSNSLLSFPSGASGPTITAMNATGVAVGNYSTTSGVVAFQVALGQSTPSTLAYTNQSNAQVYPRGVNASGQVVTTIQYGFNLGQFLYNNRQFTSLPRALVAATGIGAQGEILGAFLDNIGVQHGGKYQNGNVTTLPAPSNALTDSVYGAYTTPLAININGDITGWYYDKDVKIHGLLAKTSGSSANESPRIYMDVPQAQAILSGKIAISGWASNNQSAVSSVAIQVDGSFFGNAQYGSSRSDVCQALPSQQAGCPSIGWQYFLDTALLADGTHSIQAISTTGNERHAVFSVGVTVSNSSTPSNSLLLNIDTPSPGNNSVRGTATFSGWAFDVNSPLASLQIYIDGSNTLLAGNFPGVPSSFGINRADVCSAFGGAPNCLSSGWSSTIDTTTLSNGVHTATFVCIAANGDRKTINRSFSVSNPNPSIFAVIDQPGNAATLSKTIIASGWAVDTRLPINVIGGIQLMIDGLISTLPNIYYGGYRPDVCQVVSAGLNCPNVGWSATIDTTQLGNGLHTIQAVAKSQANSFNLADTVTTQPSSFLVNNSSLGNTTLLTIDQPNPSLSQVFSGTAVLSGWAVDSFQPIQSILLFMDGIQVGTTKPSVNRPDVCTVLPNRPNCPNVGWSIPLNTNIFANGTHTLTITAQTSLGSQATHSVPFIIRNNDGALSTIITVDSPNATTGLVSGSVTFSGWAINEDQPIGRVDALVDGAPYSAARTGLSRPDVCQFYPTFPDCASSGWTLPVDTTLFTNGVHSLTLTTSIIGTLPSYSQNASALTYFTVNNNAATSPFLAYIDTPNSRTVPSGVINASGWALHKTSLISSLTVAVDGVFFGTASYSINRSDVCSVYPSYRCPTNKQIGWSFPIDTTLLANGQHTLSLTSTAADDGTHQTISTTFIVAN